MKKRSPYLFLLLCFSIFVPFAYAGESLSLEQALRIAYVENPNMVQARQELRASKGRWIQAETPPNPEAALEIGGLRKGGDDERKGNVDSFLIQQPLDPLGTRFLKGRIGYDGVKIAKQSRILIWSDIASRVRENYARILAQEKALEVARQNLETTRQFLSRVEIRFQSGSALQSEVIRAKIENLRSENDVLLIEKNLKLSKGEMNLLLGRSADLEFELSDALSYEPLRFEYQGMVERALQARADLKMEHIKLSSANKTFQSALLKTVFPKMAIGVERTMESYENDTAIVLEASYPLWDLNWGEVKATRAEREKQKTRLEAFKRQVGLEVYQSFLEAELADRQVLLQKKALDEANELLRQMTLQYESGEIPFLSFLENIKTIKETRLAYYNALKNFQEQVAQLEKVIQVVAKPEGVKE